jgi:membrane associated rhomboid family serine protease
MGSLLYITLVRQDLLSRYEIASIRNLLILNVMFTFIGSTISLTGHLGGLVTGLVISYLVIPQHRYQKDDQVYDYTNDDNDDEWWTH